MRFKHLEARLKKQGFKVIAGIDEAGRGPMAGPVVSASVILKSNSKIPGLKDSKLLSPKKREELFSIIINQSIDYAITVISHLNIDKINILNAVRQANKLCIDSMNTKPDIVIIDGRDKQIFKEPYITIIKGDRMIKSIAAASVLAKVTRDKIMERYAKEFTEYEFYTHMGYGTRKHRKLMKKHGLCEIHRKSYTWRKQ